jgi:hypothetical protein
MGVGRPKKNIETQEMEYLNSEIDSNEDNSDEVEDDFEKIMNDEIVSKDDDLHKKEDILSKILNDGSLLNELQRRLNADQAKKTTYVERRIALRYTNNIPDGYRNQVKYGDGGSKNVVFTRYFQPHIVLESDLDSFASSPEGSRLIRNGYIAADPGTPDDLIEVYGIKKVDETYMTPKTISQFKTIGKEELLKIYKKANEFQRGIFEKLVIDSVISGEAIFDIGFVCELNEMTKTSDNKTGKLQHIIQKMNERNI